MNARDVENGKGQCLHAMQGDEDDRSGELVDDCRKPIYIKQVLMTRKRRQ